jgi:riboflavin kinase/FMN adenylyltransferase
MQHYWFLEDVHLEGACLTIGSFDGVHQGHQTIIRQLTAEAKAAGVPAVVLTFHPHPSVVLRGRRGPYYLTTPEERAELLSSLGVDVVITHPFNQEVASRSAREFVSSLQRHLRMSRLCVGPDFALGHGREGDIPTLRRLGEELGFTLNVTEPFRLDGRVVSSSWIRSALADGDIESANRLLGRSYQLAGRVVRGDRRGRTLGIPTANLDVWIERAMPKSGVYACQAHVDGQAWGAVANIGVRPTFHNQAVYPRLEAHLLEFDRDLYDRHISVLFIARLRDEQRFSNVQALVDQIHQDIERAREILKDPSPSYPQPFRSPEAPD